MESNPFDEQKLRELAEARVAFKIHASIYAAVNLILWAIWTVTGGGHPWPIYAGLGWGLGVLINYLTVYGPTQVFSVEKEIEGIRRELHERA
jgi:hypothetical protein